MVIVSPILERDTVHQDRIFNTTGIYRYEHLLIFNQKTVDPLPCPHVRQTPTTPKLLQFGSRLKEGIVYKRSQLSN